MIDRCRLDRIRQGGRCQQQQGQAIGPARDGKAKPPIAGPERGQIGLEPRNQ
jgi:hypothetical protein